MLRMMIVRWKVAAARARLAGAVSDELAGTENQIATERRRYNDTIRDFNTGVQQFPNNVIAGTFGFAPREYFEADEQTQEVPTVQF